MIRRFRYLLAVLILFTACKSNQDAYNTAYRKLKEREDSLMESKAQTATTINMDALAADSSSVYRSEEFTLILGDEKNLSDYSLVVKTFINRTNARGYYGRLEEEGYPAILIQNRNLLYRIIVASFPTLEEAQAKQQQLRETFPESFILRRR
jgi:hypothetical protein